jgi:hypothetical protein
MNKKNYLYEFIHVAIFKTSTLGTGGIKAIYMYSGKFLASGL